MILRAAAALLLWLPTTLGAQEAVKTAPGFAHTPAFARQKMKHQSTADRHLTPARDSRGRGVLKRYEAPTPGYMSRRPAPARVLARTAAGTEICGSLIYRRSWEEWSELLPRPYGIYSFTATAAGIESKEVALDNKLYANGGAYVKDGVYSFVNHYTYGGERYVTFYQYDMTTWEMTTEQEADDDCVAVTLAWNPADDQVYGIFWSDDDEAYVFDCIDIEDMGGYRYHTGSGLDAKVMALACNDEGETYGIGLDGMLYLFDTDTGDAEEVGELGVTPANYLQSAAFDPKTGDLYWAAQLADGTSALYTVDTATGEARLVAEFDDGEEIVGMWVAAPAAADDAPAAVDDLAADFADGRTQGTVSFTAPTLTYGGDPLEGTLSYSIAANGSVVAKGQTEAGAKVEETVTLEDGDNTISVTAGNAQGSSPAATIQLWVGADVPEAPADIVLAIDDDTRLATLTWTAPAAGEHGGYVDADRLTYNVTRYPGAVRVAEGISQTSFAETLPEAQLTVYNYEVAAVNGAQTSRCGRSNSVAAGEGLTAPWTEDFATSQGFSLFTVIDANHDDCSWEYAYGRVRYYAGDRDADDWLLTPAVHLEPGLTYKIGFDFFASDDAKMEKIGVSFGQGGDPGKYDVMLEPEEFNNTDTLTYSDIVTVGQAGDYRMAIHALSEAEQGFITVDNVYIIEGVRFTAPAAATGLTITPAAGGLLKADIAFTTPTTTYRDGQPLGELTKVEVYRGQTLVKTFGTTAPGTQLTLTDEGMPNGANRYRVVAYNESGAGDEAAAAAWIGIDEPLEPQNIRIRDNGTDVTVSWDAPEGNEGIHGGYVDPAALKYNVYDRLGNLLVANIGQMSYIDRTAQLTGQQSLLYYYVSATSAGGEGYADASARMVAGTPYQLPFSCSFANGGLENRLWWLEGKGRGSWVVTYMDAQDGDGGSAFFAADAAGDQGYLNSGRISLSGAQHPGLVFYYDAKPGSNVRLDVMACAVTDDDQLLRTIDYSTLEGEPGWRREYVDLTPLKDARYVILKFRATSYDTQTSVAIDNIQVRDVMSHDLAATLQAPVVLRLGAANNIAVGVENQGSMLATAFTARLMADGQQVASADGTQLGVGQSQTFSFSYVPGVVTEGDVELQAVVDYEADENTANNASAAVSVRTQKPDYPVATDLAATATAGCVALSWTAPELPSADVTDDFESYTPWIFDGIGQWTVYDGDKAGTMQYSDIWVPNAGKEFAFEVFNNTDEEFETETRRKFLRAHSGVQYLCQFDPSPSYGKASDDWLISPLLSGEAQTVRFFAKSLAGNYPETFEVLCSDTDTQPQSFTCIETFPNVKGGLVWNEYNVALPEGTKYFAVHVTTYDGLGFQIDDISYRQASLVIEGYNVYRDGQLVGHTADTTFTDCNVADGEHVYQVSVVYSVGESLLSEETQVACAIRLADGTVTTVAPGQGCIMVRGAQGHAVSIFTPDGRRVATAEGSALTRVPVSTGVYIVKVGRQTVNISVR